MNLLIIIVRTKSRRQNSLGITRLVTELGEGSTEDRTASGRGAPDSWLRGASPGLALAGPFLLIFGLLRSDTQEDKRATSEHADIFHI